MLMWNSSKGNTITNSEWSEGPMNGEGCDLSVPSPALAGYLGNVSCALFSPTVTCAKLLLKKYRFGMYWTNKSITKLKKENLCKRRKLRKC